MPYLVGADEAGYGPNLGPLVVSATVWRVASIQHTDLFTRLGNAVRQPGANDAREGELLIGDSKALYKRGKGLAGLEQGVFPCLAAVNKKPRTWQKIWQDLAKQDAASLAELPWYRDFDEPLPLEFTIKDVRERAQRFMTECESAHCVPTQIASRAIFPVRFNELCEQHGNKASALSQTTLELVESVLKKLPADEPVYVLCDKHGGRNKYGPLLNQFFPDTLAMVRHEGRDESAYQLGQGERRREFVFRAKADAGFLPTALASMVSKYLRELAMRAFNDYWSSHVDDLKPTAGYPLDAKRFKREIEPAQQKLGIEDHLLWRSR